MTFIFNLFDLIFELSRIFAARRARLCYGKSSGRPSVCVAAIPWLHSLEFLKIIAGKCCSGSSLPCGEEEPTCSKGPSRNFTWKRGGVWEKQDFAQSALGYITLIISRINILRSFIVFVYIHFETIPTV